MRALRRRQRQPHEDASALVESALIDAAVDAYAVWREESRATRRAYRRWREAGCGDRPAAFAAYTGALDREQRAAELYATLIGYYVGVRRGVKA